MEWFYAVGGERKGPVTQDALAELVSAGVVTDASLVWHEGMADWQPFAMHRAVVAPAIPPEVPAGGPVFCTHCGRATAVNELVPIGGRRVCFSCKPIVLQQMREGSFSFGQQHRCAGFWIRFAAVLIDAIIMGIAGAVTGLILGTGLINSGDGAAAVLVNVINFVMGAVYESIMIANFGATVGKMACGLKVIRVSGGNPALGLAIGRHFAKFVSALILLIGYLMAAWDEEKRALHDRICDTRVIKAR